MPAETMSDANAIPVIDLGPFLAGEPRALDLAAAELRHALTEIGFYTIVNHGVPSALVHEVYRQVARFHTRPLDEKLKIKLDKHNVGYLPMMGDTLRTSVVTNVTKPNMSEAFFMARDLACDHPDVVSGRRFRSANQWPDDLPGFREPLVEYCEALERLVQRLVRVYARALDLPAAYFDGPFTDFQYKLRATHYPSQPKAPDDEFGIAPHTDLPDAARAQRRARPRIPHPGRRLDRGPNRPRRLYRQWRAVVAALDQRSFPRNAAPRNQPHWRRALRAGVFLRRPNRLADRRRTDLRRPRPPASIRDDLLHHYMICYQARTYNVFDDQAKDAAE